MMSNTLVSNPVFKPEISFDVRTELFEEKATIVHCTVAYATRLRIWPSTFLVQEDGSRKKMRFAYHISEYPQWAPVQQNHRFTLVFEPLDKHCAVFDLFEDIPEPGGFHWRNIRRKSSDVYELGLDRFRHIVYQ